MREPSAPYSASDRRRIEKRARRRLGSELNLILSAGFGAVFTIVLFFGQFLVVPLSQRTGLRPTVVLIALSLCVTVVWAVGHARRAGPRIKRGTGSQRGVSLRRTGRAQFKGPDRPRPMTPR
ncbi:hypothetical protein [Sulfitobacter sp. S190]|uniref:hypothetical protein n=1 Tax=Sulfitobacter sp. S190 TaxID=2867022 RepID=UPI0021A3C4C2|nr:hypothetical protein [Sulfitobacter sp. S190]UWR23527.1 hypothetical protein K3756_05995 [Sulfitobacter sp. S190]